MNGHLVKNKKQAHPEIPEQYKSIKSKYKSNFTSESSSCMGRYHRTHSNSLNKSYSGCKSELAEGKRRLTARREPAGEGAQKIQQAQRA